VVGLSAGRYTGISFPGGTRYIAQLELGREATRFSPQKLAEQDNQDYREGNSGGVIPRGVFLAEWLASLESKQPHNITVR